MWTLAAFFSLVTQTLEDWIEEHITRLETFCPTAMGYAGGYHCLVTRSYPGKKAGIPEAELRTMERTVRISGNARREE